MSFLNFILAQLSNFKIKLVNSRTVRLEWVTQEFDSTDDISYDYIVYYEEIGVSQTEKTTSVPTGARFTTIGNLRERALYQFAVAISKRVGREQTIGKRTSPKRIRTDTSVEQSGESQKSRLSVST